MRILPFVCPLLLVPLLICKLRGFGHWNNGPGEAVQKDCYFDPVCHGKVDWDQITKIKFRFFKRLEFMKKAGARGRVKFLMARAHHGFARAGMPEDRIDYILIKWVKSVFPEALGALHADIAVSGFTCDNGYGRQLNQRYLYQGVTKDGRPFYRGEMSRESYIYYDYHCSEDTPQPRWLLGGKPSLSRDSGLNEYDGQGCQNDFSIITDSMSLPGGEQHLAWQWCGDHGLFGRTVSISREAESAEAPEESEEAEDRRFDVERGGKARWHRFAAAKTHCMDGIRRRAHWALTKLLSIGKPKAPEAEKEAEVDRKDCYFDKECHDKVDWVLVGRMKMGFFARLKFLKERRSPAGVKGLWRHMHHGLAKAGMPEDRIDYVLMKWVKSVYPEALEKEAEVDRKDCYFDKECHDKVDWVRVGRMKMGFFARLKLLKEKRSPAGVKGLWKHMHYHLAKAGMPEDRIDYILMKWLKFVYPEALEAEKEAEVDRKDCYFDKDCHDKVDWDSVSSMKEGFFTRLKLMNQTLSPERLMFLAKDMHAGFAKAGMPEDRIDYTLMKLGKSLYPKALDAGKQALDIVMA